MGWKSLLAQRLSTHPLIPICTGDAIAISQIAKLADNSIPCADVRSRKPTPKKAGRTNSGIKGQFFRRASKADSQLWPERIEIPPWVHRAPSGFITTFGIRKIEIPRDEADCSRTCNQLAIGLCWQRLEKMGLGSQSFVHLLFLGSRAFAALRLTQGFDCPQAWRLADRIASAVHIELWWVESRCRQ